MNLKPSESQLSNKADRHHLKVKPSLLSSTKKKRKVRNLRKKTKQLPEDDPFVKPSVSPATAKRPVKKGQPCMVGSFPGLTRAYSSDMLDQVVDKKGPLHHSVLSPA